MYTSYMFWQEDDFNETRGNVTETILFLILIWSTQNPFYADTCVYV